jgi:hypothetical protein
MCSYGVPPALAWDDSSNAKVIIHVECIIVNILMYVCMWLKMRALPVHKRGNDATSLEHTQINRFEDSHCCVSGLLLD